MNDTLQILFSGIVALSTVVYAILTWRLVKETKKTREFQITPDIQVYFERGEANWKDIYIIIENLGFGTAKMVQFEILRDYEHYEDKIFHLSEKGIIKNGMKMFYPKQKFRFMFTNLGENYELKIKSRLILKVDYLDINDKLFTTKFNLSLQELSGMSTVVPPDNYIGRISYYLEKINKTLENIKTD